MKSAEGVSSGLGIPWWENFLSRSAHPPWGTHFVVTKAPVRQSHADVSPSVGEDASYVLPATGMAGLLEVALTPRPKLHSESTP